MRSGLGSIDTELRKMPATQPMVDQLNRLSAALQTMPDLGSYLTGLAGLLTATAAAPSVDALSSTWSALNASLLLVPSFTVTQPPLEVYATEEALLPKPPTALLDGSLHLQSLLHAVPRLVTTGKTDLSDTYSERLGAMRLLQRGALGDDLGGYFQRLQGMRPVVESSWWTFLSATFATPAALAAVSVLACMTRTGRPALHAGHGLLSILPWYMLLGASIEMPLALMLQDACDQVSASRASGNQPRLLAASALASSLLACLLACLIACLLACLLACLRTASVLATRLSLSLIC